jgi:two-component system nitrogen regulation sensor histidine kinase GlnL
VPEELTRRIKVGRPKSRIFLWSLLGIFNAFLWLLLLAFHWEISLRAREVRYFGTQLFPVKPPQGVPLQAIYAACALLTTVSAAAIVRDRKNQVARERLRTLLFQILDSLEIAVVVLDEKNLLAMANASSRTLLPEIPADYVGLDILGLLQSRPQLQEILRSASDSRSYIREVDHDLGRDGEPLEVRLTTLPLRDPHGRTTGTLLLVHDVREALRLERQMRIAERLSSLGTLAAGMAHEIRNPLEAMNLNLALLARNLDAGRPSERENGKVQRYVHVLESEISRLAAIVENFLSFARPSGLPVSQVALDELLRQIVDLIGNQARSRSVSLDLAVDGNPTVTGSPDRLKQAFLNLAINGLEAMPDGGTLRIRAEAAKEASTGRDRQLAVISIQDSGVGIPPEHIAHVFDPFFTTRPKGTGLGLATVQRVIHDHSGRIEVSSVPGQGSTFRIEIPLSAPERR